MKKLLSILLSVMIILGTMTCLMLIPASAAAVVTAAEGGAAVANGDGSYTAKPYYGNTFLGWYSGDALVSASPTITPESDVTAKFKVYNQIVDGNFEINNGSAENYFVLTNTTNNTAVVVDKPNSANAGHGDKAMLVTTNGVSTAMNYIIKLPVTVEKNKEYMLRLSYYVVGTSNGVDTNTSLGTIVFHSSASHTNNWTATAVPEKWSLVWGNETADDILSAPGAWTFKGDANTAKIVSTHASVGTGEGKWIDVAYMIDPGESTTIFADGEDTAECWLTFGVGNDAGFVENSSDFYIDNVSFTEAAETAKAQISVVAGENGSVSASAAAKGASSVYYYATASGAKDKPHTDWVVANTAARYQQMVTNAGVYTATADEGYKFDGWYDANDNLISENAEEYLAGETTYTAKFVRDASQAVNLIVNGDGNGGAYTDADVANSSYTGEFDKNAPIGWRDLSTQYANAKYLYPHTFDINKTYSNYSPSNVIALNSWQSLVQDVRIEAGKTYVVTAKVTMNAGNATQTGRSISIGMDAGVDMAAASLKSTNAWYAKKDLVFETIKKKDGTTDTTWTGDFTTLTFTFNSDDFIAANSLTAGADGKYHARFVLNNDCTGYAMVDDVTMYEATPFEAVVEKQNDIYGGYITGDSAGVLGQNATVKANAYYGNTFDGWYVGGTRVSTEPVYSFAVTEGLKLVAKFNVNNLWPDSGYENYPLETNLLYTDGGDRNYPLWYSEQTSIYWHAKVSNEKVGTGAQALKLTHRNNYVSTNIAVAKNTDYIFSFDWEIKTKILNSETQQPTYLSDVIIKDKNGIVIADYALNTNEIGSFQNTKVYFNSGDTDEVIISLRYYAGSDCIYMDDFAVVPGTPDNDYVKVTYDSNDATVGTFYEYVKAGTAYTVRKATHAIPVAKTLLGYKYDGAEYAVGDVITLGTEDIVLKAFYEDYISGKLTNNTSFDPDDYDYTFVLLPDEQNVNELYPNYYTTITQWIVDNKDEYNIQGAISMGDITQGAAYSEWARAYEAYMLLEDAGIPFALTPGNHDYDFGISHSNPTDQTVRRNEYMDFFFNRNTVDYSRYTTCPYTGDSLINSYYTVETTNEKYLIMALEIFPRDEVLDWANDVVEAHPDHKIIAATHSHIFADGSYGDDYDDYPINYPQGSNSAEQVLEKFILKHENMFIFFCGHSSSDPLLTKPVVGEHGNTVYQILADQQNVDKNEKGVGIVVLVGVDEENNRLGFTTYSTLQGKYYLTDQNEFTIQYGKASQAAPAAPTVASKDANSVTLNAVAGAEYSKDGNNWQASPVFTGLLPNTEYTFYQRLAETAELKASPASAGTVQKTDKGSAAAPAAPTVAGKTDTTVTLTENAGYEYSKDGATWQASGVFTGLSAATEYTFYQRIAETSDYAASPASPALKVTTDKSATAAPAAPSVASKTDTTVTLNTVAGYEYSKDGTTWQASPVFTGLSAATEYSFYQRVAETATAYASPASAAVKATTEKSTPAAPAAPTVASKTDLSVTLVAIAGYEYSRNGVNWQASPTFDGLAAATEYTFYQRIAETATSNASAASAGAKVTTNKITVAAPAAPEVDFVVAMMVMLKEVPGYEYSMDGVNWQASVEFSGLKANTEYTFYQRVAETAETYASPASAGTKATTDKWTVFAPVAPVAAERTETSITLKATAGYEYSMDGVTWQASPEFTGLTAKTEYTFYQRTAETNDSFASAASEAAKITTLKPANTATVVPVEFVEVTKDSVTLKEVEGYEYSKDGGKTWQASPVFTGLTPETEYTFAQRIVESDEYEASAAESATKTTLAAPVVSEPGDSSETTPSEPDKNEGTTVPPTGDSTNVWMWVVLLVLSGAAAAFTFLKKRSASK